MQYCWLTIPNIVGCYALYPFAHPVARCCVLLGVVAQSLKLVKLLSQQLPTFLLLRDRQSVVQQCWISVLSTSNIVWATHTHYTCFSKSYGFYPSMMHLSSNIVGSCCIRLHTTANTDATTANIVGPRMLGVVASVCTPLPTRMQQLPTLLAQECWELLHPFARSLKFMRDFLTQGQKLSL